MSTPQESAVKTLTELLERAKNGEVTALLVSSFGPSGQMNIQYSAPDTQKLTLLGTLPLAQDMIVNDFKKTIASQPT